MANKKNIGGQELQIGATQIAQQSAICSVNFNVQDLHVVYAYDHHEGTFQNVIFSQGFTATLREAAILVDMNASVFGSQSMKVARVVSDYDNGFITAKDKETELENLLFPEAFDDWDEDIRIWTNADAGITIGAAPLEEFLTLLPDEALTMLQQGITEELKERKNAQKTI